MTNKSGYQVNENLNDLKKLDEAQKSLQSLMNKSQQSKQTASSFRTPNVVVNDYKFEADKMLQEEQPGVHPILGTQGVRNFNEVDWEGLKYAH